MKSWQVQIQAAVIEKYGRPLLKEPVEMNIEFFCTLPGPRPKTHTTWLRRCWRQVGKRPDRTNLLKAAEDGLIGTLFQDDSIVVCGDAKKWFTSTGFPYTRITVTPLRLPGAS